MSKFVARDVHGPVHLPTLDVFAQSGIYFLHRSDVVVYVGQAVDMRRRIGQHIGDASKVFDAVSCVPCEVHNLDRLERKYIERLVPEYNRCRLSELLRQGSKSEPQRSIAEVTGRRRVRHRPRPGKELGPASGL